MIMSQLLWPSGTPFRLKPVEIKGNIAAARQNPLPLPEQKKGWEQREEHSVLLTQPVNTRKRYSRAKQLG